MKNKEKYADEIMESFADNKRCDFVRKHILKKNIAIEVLIVRIAIL